MATESQKNAFHTSGSSPGEPDFRLRDEDSIFLLQPLSLAALSWVEEHIGEDNGYQPLWPSVLIERRYAHTILAGLVTDGLTWEVA